MKQNLIRLCLWCLFVCFTLCSGLAFAQHPVKGKVTNTANNSPIPNVSVLIKGTTTGTVTNANGEFSLNVPDNNAVLVFSCVGYTQQEQAVNGLPVINVSLTENAGDLEVVVLTGYTAQKKKDLTGAVAVVNMQELKSQPAASPVEALQGKATGVQIISDGAPGSTPQIRIRGNSTINNNDPLYVIDGVPYKGKLGWLNQDDIESMQVLKDASAASIYGSRANNGVIIITTKRGTKGAPKVTFNTYLGSQDPNRSRFPKFLDPMQYAKYFYQEFINAGLTPGLSSTTGSLYGTSPTTPTLPEYLLAGTTTGQDITAAEADPSKYNYSTDPNTFYQITKANQQGTNWMKVISHNALMQNYGLNVGGGGDNSSYIVSGNYFKQDGTIRYTNFQRAEVRANSNFSALNNHLTIGENMQYSWNKGIGFATNPNTAGGYQGEGSPLGWMYRMQTIIPVYDIMGNFAGTKGGGLGNAENPLAVLYRARNNAASDNQFFGSAFADVKIIDGLDLKSTFGIQYDNFKWNTISVPNPEFSEGSYDRNTLAENQGYTSNWTWTNTLTYKKKFNGKHDLTVLFGTEAVKGQNRTLTGNGNGFYLFGDPNYYLLSAANSTSATESAGNSSLFSLFGRVDYAFEDKYLLALTVRRDGSSNFGPANKYGNFPAASAAWRISNEDFMKPVKWINDLKLRVGYGITGNQDIPAFQYVKIYQASLTTSYYPINLGTPTSGLWASQYDNPDIKWEQAQSLNIGLDWTLFTNHFDGSFDWYNKNTKDMLFAVPMPAAAVGGGASPYQNIGKMNNKGMELSLNYHYNPSGSDNEFRFDLGANISRNINKIVELSSGVSKVLYNTIRDVTTSVLLTGAPMGSFYGYKQTGIYQSAEDLANSPAYEGARIGGPKFADISGPDGKPDGIIDDNDRTVIGNPFPKFIYSLSFNAYYKRFDVTMFFNGSQGNDIFDMTRYYTDLNGFDGAVTTRMLNAWSPTNTGSMIPSPYRNAPTTERTSSSYYVQNGSFLKMKNLQIGYTLPTKKLFNNRISSFRIYVSATNLFTITKYSGMDPEISQMLSTVGNTTYSVPGVDLGSVPMSRQYLIGLSATF